MKCDEADYEVELAIIIGKLCKDVSVADAQSYVLGYATANDVTARQHQDRTSQWSYAKGMVCVFNSNNQKLKLIFTGRVLSPRTLYCLDRVNQRSR